MPPYRHITLKYLTFSEEEWDAIGDSARKDWKEKQSEPEVKPQPEPELEWSLDNMTLEQLQLDEETNALAEQAMNQMDISLAELIKRSIKVYTKTVVGKSKKADEDLPNPSLLTANRANVSDDRGLIKMLTKNIDYFQSKPVSIPKITILLDHGYQERTSNMRS